METYHGYIETTDDALLIFEACRLGMLQRVSRRLCEDERRCIQSGSVFVWDESESGIRRWTDGKRWSPSRVNGCFLIYTELEPKIQATAGDRYSMSASNSATFQKQKQASAPSPQPPDVPLAQGLVKKALSLFTAHSSKLHLVCYYRKEDLASGKLVTPSQDSLISGLPIPRSLYPDIIPELIHTIPSSGQQSSSTMQHPGAPAHYTPSPAVYGGWNSYTSTSARGQAPTMPPPPPSSVYSSSSSATPPQPPATQLAFGSNQTRGRLCLQRIEEKPAPLVIHKRHPGPHNRGNHPASAGALYNPTFPRCQPGHYDRKSPNSTNCDVVVGTGYMVHPGFATEPHYELSTPPATAPPLRHYSPPRATPAQTATASLKMSSSSASSSQLDYPAAAPLSANVPLSTCYSRLSSGLLPSDHHHRSRSADAGHRSSSQPSVHSHVHVFGGTSQQQQPALPYSSASAPTSRRSTEGRLSDIGAPQQKQKQPVSNTGVRLPPISELLKALEGDSPSSSSNSLPPAGAKNNGTASHSATSKARTRYSADPWVRTSGLRSTICNEGKI
ncbi:hypothetical protein GQ54DRAFT_299120 [Martensiomyces pterosporus]|nr:hypothetical protein GQ54DRAFT_299120 [Martensiomyces pterosporus]